MVGDRAVLRVLDSGNSANTKGAVRSWRGTGFSENADKQHASDRQRTVDQRPHPVVRGDVMRACHSISVCSQQSRRLSMRLIEQRDFCLSTQEGGIHAGNRWESSRQIQPRLAKLW